MNSNISFDSIAISLWGKYVDEPNLEVQKLPRGFKNTSFVVKNHEGAEFVLKVYAPNFLTSEAIEERANIVKHLESIGLPVLEMLPGLDGQFCQRVQMPDGQEYLSTVSKFIAVPFGDTGINLSSIAETSKSLKELHKALAGFRRMKTIKGIDVVSTLEVLVSKANLENISEYFRVDHKRKHRENEVKEFYLQKGKEILTYFKRRSPDLPNDQLCHGDFNLDNFLMRDGKIETIFDFDEMVLAPKEYEVALSIYHLDYPRETYLDRLIEIFVNSYYSQITESIIKDIIMFMQYRAFYRFGRYFAYYQFTERPGGHFTKFQDILKRLDELDADQILSDIRDVTTT